MSDENPWEYPYEGVWAMRFQAKTGYDMDRAPDAEELYQAFKERLIHEVRAEHLGGGRLALVDASEDHL